MAGSDLYIFQTIFSAFRRARRRCRMMRVYSARLPFYFLAVQAAVFDRRKMRGEKSRSIREAGGGNTGDLAACYCREKLRTWGEGREEEEEGGREGTFVETRGSLADIYIRIEPIRIYYATCYAMHA